MSKLHNGTWKIHFIIHKDEDDVTVLFAVMVSNTTPVDDHNQGLL